MIGRLGSFLVLPSTLTIFHRSVGFFFLAIIILLIISRTRKIGIGCSIILGLLFSTRLLVYDITGPITTPYPLIMRLREPFTDENGLLTTTPTPLTTTQTIIIPSTTSDPHLHLWDHNIHTLYQATGALILSLPSLQVQRGFLSPIDLDTLPPDEKTNLGLAVKKMLVERYYPGSSLPIRYLTYGRYRFLSERNTNHWGLHAQEVRNRGKKLGEVPGGTGSLITTMTPLNQWIRHDTNTDLTTQIINQSRREGWERINN